MKGLMLAVALGIAGTWTSTVAQSSLHCSNTVQVAIAAKPAAASTSVQYMATVRNRMDSPVTVSLDFEPAAMKPMFSGTLHTRLHLAGDEMSHAMPLALFTGSPAQAKAGGMTAHDLIQSLKVSCERRK